MATSTVFKLIALGGLLYMVHKFTLPRGVRNNNPLNIRESKNDHTVWEGEAQIDKDKAFEEFKSPEYGFRAGARILKSYNRQGYKTLSQVINRFAPPHENNTQLYVEQVSKWTGIKPNQVINVNDKDQLASLLHAMSRKEVGNYYGLKMARAGVELA